MSYRRIPGLCLIKVSCPFKVWRDREIVTVVWGDFVRRTYFKHLSSSIRNLLEQMSAKLPSNNAPNPPGACKASKTRRQILCLVRNRFSASVKNQARWTQYYDLYGVCLHFGRIQYNLWLSVILQQNTDEMGEGDITLLSGGIEIGHKSDLLFFSMFSCQDKAKVWLWLGLLVDD